MRWNVRTIIVVASLAITCLAVALIFLALILWAFFALLFSPINILLLIFVVLLGLLYGFSPFFDEIIYGKNNELEHNWVDLFLGKHVRHGINWYWRTGLSRARYHFSVKEVPAIVSEQENRFFSYNVMNLGGILGTREGRIKNYCLVEADQYAEFLRQQDRPATIQSSVSERIHTWLKPYLETLEGLLADGADVQIVFGDQAQSQDFVSVLEPVTVENQQSSSPSDTSLWDDWVAEYGDDVQLLLATGRKVVPVDEIQVRFSRQVSDEVWALIEPHLDEIAEYAESGEKIVVVTTQQFAEFYNAVQTLQHETSATGTDIIEAIAFAARKHLRSGQVPFVMTQAKLQAAIDEAMSSLKELLPAGHQTAERTTEEELPYTTE